MAVNRDIIVKMRLAGEDFDRDFKIKFQDLTDAAEKAAAESGTKAGKNFGSSFAKAAAASGAAIGFAINQAANLGQELANTSRQFNIGVENLQVWRQAAATAGVNANALGTGIAGLAQKIGEANAGNRQAQQGFADLGLSFKTASGQARATDEVLLDLAKRITDIEDPAERVSVGTRLLGDQFKTLYPLLLDGADGFKTARAELGEFGAMLTHEEIRNLEKTNAKIEQMKTVLSIRIAGIVAENANAIIGLADATATLTGQMVRFVTEYPKFSGMLAGAAVGYRVAGPWGAAVGAGVGLSTGAANADDLDALNMDVRHRQRKLTEARSAYNIAKFGTGEPVVDDQRLRNAERALKRQTELMMQATVSIAKGAIPTSAKPGLSALVDGLTGGSARAGSGGGRRNPTQSAADTEAVRAAKEAIRNEEQLRDAIARTLRAQQDSAEVARIRSEQGTEAAARAEAELAFLRQHPLAVNDTVESLAQALGITKELTDIDRQRLQLLIDQGNVAQKTAGDAAAEKVRDEAARAKEKADDDQIKREADRFKDEYERAIFDVANIYETAFRGGTSSLWRAFKDEGTRMIAEVAAQWTLAMIAGQTFNGGAAAGAAFGRSPIASIFFGAGGPFGAANDNGGVFGVPGFGGGIFSPGGGASRTVPLLGPLSGSSFQAPGSSAASFLQSSGLGGALVGAGAGTLFAGLSKSIGIPGSTTGGQIGGALGSFLPVPGGPFIGAIAGSLLGGLLKGTKRGSVTVGSLGGSLGITGSQGNSKPREATAAQGAGSLIDAIFQIAGQLGGDVDASRGSVSFGMRKNSFRVDPTGRGITKIGNGAIDFGSDQEAAMRFAIQDLIKDGVITGISEASQNLLAKGGNLDKQIEKALLIEQIPKLLRQRLDPLGAALDELFEKFGKVNAALVEGRASAEQFAQARQLWELEKADAIASIGTASQSLKDFLASLNAGANSPLSLREQREEAERQLQPFIAQISAAESARAEVDRLRASGASAAQITAAEEAARTAAAGINQDGFTQASQLLLGISRQAGASSGAFFSDFDRIRALTGQGIGFVDQASARDADNRDPFARETARNTADTAAIAAEHTVLLRDIRDALTRAGFYGPSSFIREDRMFVSR